MQNKLQEITDKIYREGLEKGQSEANKIVSDAKAQSNQIISDAKREAEHIISSSEKKETAEMKSNIESELKLFATQASEALKLKLLI